MIKDVKDANSKISRYKLLTKELSKIDKAISTFQHARAHKRKLLNELVDELGNYENKKLIIKQVVNGKYTTKNIDKVPDKFITHTKELNQKEISYALVNGETLPKSIIYVAEPTLVFVPVQKPKKGK